jgi:hypothetical protein
VWEENKMANDYNFMEDPNYIREVREGRHRHYEKQALRQAGSQSTPTQKKSGSILPYVIFGGTLALLGGALYLLSTVLPVEKPASTAGVNVMGDVIDAKFTGDGSGIDDSCRMAMDYTPGDGVADFTLDVQDTGLTSATCQYFGGRTIMINGAKVELRNAQGGYDTLSASLNQIQLEPQH